MNPTIPTKHPTIQAIRDRGIQHESSLTHFRSVLWNPTYSTFIDWIEYVPFGSEIFVSVYQGNVLLYQFTDSVEGETDQEKWKLIISGVLYFVNQLNGTIEFTAITASPAQEG